MKASAGARMLDAVVRRGTFAGLTVGMMPRTLPALPAGTNAGIGSDQPHGVHPHPHTLNPFAESGMANRDVLRSVPGEAADVVGRAGHKGVLRPGSDADLLVLGSSPVNAVQAITDIRAVCRAGHRAR